MPKTHRKTGRGVAGWEGGEFRWDEANKQDRAATVNPIFRKIQGGAASGAGSLSGGATVTEHDGGRLSTVEER
jgi:hypothetical protein